MNSTFELEFANALKSVARNQQIKSYIQHSKDLYPLLLRAAKRYVTGETRKDAVAMAQKLTKKGYLISTEFIGENTTTKKECLDATREFIRIIKDLGKHKLKSTISFDLSHIGLSVSKDLAKSNLKKMLREALKYDQGLMISMEESAKTNQILHIYQRLSASYPNLGITLQAHLKRSQRDIKRLLKLPGKVRLVKGAYQEPKDIAIARSPQLDKRYMSLLNECISANHPLSIATHDENILREVTKRNYMKKSHVEMEMLYGIRPDLAKELKNKGANVRIYLTYGREWYLYLCHRIAEYPPNIYSAVADIVDLTRTEKIPY